jgi:hypothetical protein
LYLNWLREHVVQACSGCFLTLRYDINVDTYTNC